MKSKLVLIAGPPGAGKSTMARKFNAPVIERDEIRHELFGIFDSVEKARAYHTSKDRHKNERRVHAVWTQRLVDSITNNPVTVVSDTLLNKRILRQIFQLADKYGIDIEFHMLYPTLAETLKRNKQRKKEKRVPEHIVIEMWDRVPEVRRWVECERKVKVNVHVS